MGGDWYSGLGSHSQSKSNSSVLVQQNVTGTVYPHGARGNGTGRIGAQGVAGMGIGFNLSPIPSPCTPPSFLPSPQPVPSPIPRHAGYGVAPRVLGVDI